MRHGFLLINKPRGPTSHDVVGMVRKTLGERSVGHLGTLDPMATGLMILAVGAKALKIVEFFAKLPKEYKATIRFGATSSTYDAEGVIERSERKPGWEPPEDAAKIQVLLHEKFTGKIPQIPPAYSAIQIGGERAYRKAMRGENVEMKAREITIQECSVLRYEYPIVEVRVRCDAGTYIRSLAHDLGTLLRCGAYLEALERTKVGEWDYKNAVEPKQAVWTDVVPLKDLLQNFPRRELTEAEWTEIRHGRNIEGRAEAGTPLFAWHQGLPVAVLELNKNQNGMLKPRKVL